MFKSLFVVLACLIAVCSFTTRAEASAGTRLQASMRGPGQLKAVGRYEERPRGNVTEQRFKVELQGAKPGTQFEVRVNGVVMGTITANGFGRGELDQRVNGDNPGTGVPSLPHIVAGNSITVGTLSGTFILN